MMWKPTDDTQKPMDKMLLDYDYDENYQAKEHFHNTHTPGGPRGEGNNSINHFRGPTRRGS